jgi:predicted metalloprotease
MGVKVGGNRQAGFAVVEAVLLVVLVAAIVGVGAFVVHQKHTADTTLASTNTSAGNAPTGTTANIDQLTEQDADTESSVDNTADNSYQQAAVGPNASLSNVGGAYNESNY